MAQTNIWKRDLALVVAVAENGVIGRDGDMPWRLSNDLQRFKKLTLGHHLIMGRKTFESIGRLLPGRTTVIITRQPGYEVDGASIVHSLDQALLAAAGDDCPFVVGGAEIYRLALPWINHMHVTHVHTVIDDGDTFFPYVNYSAWHVSSDSKTDVDEKNQFETTYRHYLKSDQ